MYVSGRVHSKEQEQGEMGCRTHLSGTMKGSNIWNVNKNNLINKNIKGDMLRMLDSLALLFF